jgi:choline kinase
MGQLTETFPKCLTVFAGRRLIDWQIAALNAAGIEEIGIVTGYQAGEIDATDLYQFHNDRWAETNMVMSLACARRWLVSEPVIVSYADIFYSAEPVKKLAATLGDITLTYDRDWLDLWQARFEDPLSDAETFQIDDDGRLVEIGAPADSVEEIEGQFMGLLRFTPTGWSAVERIMDGLSESQCDRLDSTALLRRLIEQRFPITTVAINGGWGEIDSASDLVACEALYRDGAFAWMT